ncbi:CdaR family transcriptional regulator [Vaginisenegalia massiliensis]|uniref:CdaR family transcriptional regulator n=1 Tax=Vaginisenegalia massiliensis TaxID=2058294 RepID=UPI000F532AA4|nr:sugar diacid recognition domain-containing protein [Vaginisenegalia massiliensis]
MELHAQIANKIVHAMKKIINQDLNFMNSTGHIIASTDSKRIGHFHEAALRCIQEQKTLIIDNDQLYQGSKAGINMPVFFNHQVIGVIGITGQPQQVEIYGHVIKQMTEILILEEWQHHHLLHQRSLNRSMIDSILFHDNHSMDSIFTFPKTACLHIASLNLDHSHWNTMDINERILNEIDQLQKRNESFWASILDRHLICLFKDYKVEEINSRLNQLLDLLKPFTSDKLIFGVSEEFTIEQTALNYFKQSQYAFEWGQFDSLQNQPIIHYSQMNLGLLIVNLNEATKLQFKTNILHQIPPEDLVFYQQLVSLYGQYNGSLIQLANHFSMHKNTVQYRINRLYQYTGYNLRHYDDYCVLKLAFMMENHPIIHTKRP